MPRMKWTRTVSFSLSPIGKGLLLIWEARVSEATRNLALDHGSSVPFQRNYLGRAIPLDLWGIMRGQNPQHALVKQSCTVGHSISKRRPTALTAEQAASITTHPDIRRLEKQLRGLSPRSKACKDTRRKIRNEKQRLKRALLQKNRDDWTEQQAVDDIERHLQGRDFPVVASENAALPQRPAQKRLLEALTAPGDGTLEDYYRRRCAAVDAIVAYCPVEEGRTPGRQTTQGPLIPGTPPYNSGYHSSSKDDRVSQAMLSVFVKSKKDRPKRCFLCIGAARSLGWNDPQLPQLLREFYTPGDLTKHFRRRHLSRIKEDETLTCQVCELPLEHKMHIQNHALRVHGTVS